MSAQLVPLPDAAPVDDVALGALDANYRAGVNAIAGFAGIVVAGAQVFAVVDAAAPAPAITAAAAAAQITNQGTLQQAATNALANLEAGAANWGALTAAQKDALALLCVRVCARLVRLVLRQLSSPGV